MATKQIFVNLPVKNLDKTKAFFAALGYTFNEQFTDANAACLVIQEGQHPRHAAGRGLLQDLHHQEPSPTPGTAPRCCCASRARAAPRSTTMVAKAVAAGGTVPREPQDYGFMYGHGFQDIDGHLWELMYMDPNAEMPQAINRSEPGTQ
jgi:predicted lactoylglutathione lyase